MRDYNHLKEIVERLHNISFNEVIKYNDAYREDVYKYGFEKNDDRLKNVENYCTICDKLKRCESLESGFKLTNISHGSHTIDFLRSFDLNDDDIKKLISEWNDDPVLFLMENPSLNYDIYDYLSCDENEEGKRVSKEWYWIGENCNRKKLEEYDGDSFYIQGEYGNMVMSLIKQFKLGNAYLTNAVKCAMTDARYENGKFVETKYKNTFEYPKEYKCKCLDNVLLKEIKALCDKNGNLQPLRIFAFGGNAHWLIKEYLEHSKIDLCYQLYQLPHPASREKNDYRKYILKGIVKDSLESEIFIKAGSKKEKYNKEFVKNIIEETYNVASLGNNATKNQNSLKIYTYNSLFDNEELVSEVKIKGKANEIFNFTWGVGYVFETKNFWYWNYDTNEYINPNMCNNIYFDSFRKAIDKIINAEKI
ncbi:MAG TPA: hypothetical protein HA355_05060 [Methanosphaera sp.]|nr:hypothetical protein [Methanosphaera sp.]